MDIGKISSILLDNKFIINVLGCSLILFLVFNGTLQNLLINAFLLIYLSHKTFKTIKSSDNENSKKLIELLKQWTCSSLLIGLDIIIHYMLGIVWLFVYNLLKV